MADAVHFPAKDHSAGNLSRRQLLAMATAAAAPASALAQPVAPRPNEDGPFDLVIRGGRALDPETGLEALRDIGVNGDRIAAISERPLKGAKILEAEGQVAAPGFIDLHAHGQQLPAAWVKAFDGVTTQLELESGMLPIHVFYDLVAKEGRPTNYGASVAWAYARIAEKNPDMPAPDATLGWFGAAFSKDNWQNSLATPDELERIIARVEQGLREGGVGIGVNGGYAPGYGRKEYYRLAQLAAKYDVPTFTHMRYGKVTEPFSAFEALEEVVALAAATGAHMHVCHLNSTTVKDSEACARLLLDAQMRGLPLTTEAYPYGAASSVVGAELYRGKNWWENYGMTGPNMELDGKPLSVSQIEDLQRTAPGTVIVVHLLDPEKNANDQKLLDASVLFPGGAIASDGMPWGDGEQKMVEGDIWPLPDKAFAHPRSAGTFSRFIRQYVRERKALSLLEAVRKCSLIPAQILEKSTPSMTTKGRLQVGADADLVVFDPATITDRATFVDPAQLSSGFRHVLVNGTPIITEGRRIAGARPGRPVRRDHA